MGTAMTLSSSGQFKLHGALNGALIKISVVYSSGNGFNGKNIFRFLRKKLDFERDAR